MVVPKYVQEILSRAKFAIGYGEAGYTIEIDKATHYTYADTLRKEIERLQRWVVRNMPKDDLGVPTMIINRIPKKTHYCRQFAVVTIYDPIMQRIEKYIKGE